MDARFLLWVSLFQEYLLYHFISVSAMGLHEVNQDMSHASVLELLKEIFHSPWPGKI